MRIVLIIIQQSVAVKPSPHDLRGGIEGPWRQLGVASGRQEKFPESAGDRKLLLSTLVMLGHPAATLGAQAVEKHTQTCADRSQAGRMSDEPPAPVLVQQCIDLDDTDMFPSPSIPIDPTQAQCAHVARDRRHCPPGIEPGARPMAAPGESGPRPCPRRSSPRTPFQPDRSEITWNRSHAR